VRSDKYKGAVKVSVDEGATATKEGRLTEVVNPN